jgi:hypothetical protein
VRWVRRVRQVHWVRCGAQVRCGGPAFAAEGRFGEVSP